MIESKNNCLNSEMEPNNPKTRGEFEVITDEARANRILDKILENEYAVVGMDTEAALEMSRFGILCLIQVRKIFFILILI